MTPKTFEEELTASEEKGGVVRAALVLEDGTRYDGLSFGADLSSCSVSGEVRDYM